MKLIKPVLWTLFGVAIGAAAVIMTSRLEAQENPRPGLTVCADLGSSQHPEEWMNKQLSSGRSHFVSLGSRLCAW